MLDLSTAETRSLVRRRIWSMPRPGTLAPVSVGSDARSRAALCAAASALARPGSVISHVSAAVLHGLAVLEIAPPGVATIAPGRPHGVSDRSLYRAPLDGDEITTWFGRPVTAIARTVIDVARAGGRAAGLVTADAALRERFVSPRALQDQAIRCAGWPGSRSARWVADHADALAESPLESVTRECVLRGGLPRPELQAVIVAPTGQHDRVDLLWRDQRVVLEADGRLKYRSDPDALWHEKRRQERIEQQGYRVVRVSWREVVDEPQLTVNRVQSALDWLR